MFKNKITAIRVVLLVLALAVVAVIVASIMTFSAGDDDEKVKIGCVLIGDTNDRGWNQSHIEGLRVAAGRLDCDLFYSKNVPEEKEACEKAVNSLLADGCSIIFLTSYGYGEISKDIARANPNVAFFTISNSDDVRNMTTYFARLYQIRYLTGLVAGITTRSGKIGYVASMENSEVNRDINAFALGVRKVNPDAKVVVSFTGSWNDEEKERECARNLIDYGADIITYHEDIDYATKEADSLGVYTIGYNVIYGKYSDKLLTAALFDWDEIYENVITEFLKGKSSFSGGHWEGINDGAIRLSDFSSHVPEEAKRVVEEETNRLNAYWDIFSDRIIDNKGNVRCNNGERLSDDELLYHMDWFVEGVEFYGK